MISLLSSYIADFCFLRPWFLIFLIVPLFFYQVIYKNVENLSSWEKVCDKTLLKYLLIKGKTSQRRLSVFLMYLGLIFAVLAMSGPSFRKEKIPVLISENPVTILLNLSSDETQKDKLTRAKIEISDLMQRIKGAESGLIVYTDEPFVVSPLSNDPNLIVNLLKAVQEDIIPVNGDRLDRAIEFAVQKLNDAGYSKGQIVVLSDSGGMYIKKAVDAARNAFRKQIFVITISLSNQSNPDLKKVAEAGGGISTNLSEDAAEIAAQKINQIYQTNLKESKNFNENRIDEGWYLLFIPLLCCLYFFRKGVLVMLVVFFSCQQAQAGLIWSSNQEGQKLFKQDKFEQAAEKFSDFAWKASAYYKAGNFEKAAEFFHQQDTESLYNRANALAKSGKINEAIKLYEEVLKQNPQHEDALFNLEYLKQQQNQNKNQQQNQDKQNNQDQNKDQQQNRSENTQNQEKQTGEKEQEQSEDDQNQEKNKQNQAGDDQKDQQSENQSEGQSRVEEKQNEDKLKDDPQLKDQKQTQQNKAEKGKEDAFAVPKEAQDKKSENFDEQIQAREQKFREIPEDKGGLLKAFILKEYLKNRYGDER